MSESKVCENCKQQATVYAMDTISDGWGSYYCDSHIPTGFYTTDRLTGEAMTDEIELASCSRCEEKVDASTLAAYGNWELCEICQGDI